MAASLATDGIQPSIEAMRWAREVCSQPLDRMTEDDWNIVGTHTVSGRYSDGTAAPSSKKICDLPVTPARQTEQAKTSI